MPSDILRRNRESAEPGVAPSGTVWMVSVAAKDLLQPKRVSSSDLSNASSPADAGFLHRLDPG